MIYVLGFAISSDLSQVLLIEKARPVWQKGKLNGVGGKVEVGERPMDAMAREFWEETGTPTDSSNWKRFATLRGDWGSVHCYFTHAVDFRGRKYVETDEPVCIIDVRHLDQVDTIPNVRWLVPMALSFRRGEIADRFEIYET